MNRKSAVFPIVAVALTIIYVCCENRAIADVYDISASADARVLTFFPNSNEGNGALLSVYNSGPGNTQRTYLYFDLLAQSGLTLTGDGTLNLWATADANDFVSNGALFLAGGSWDESLITWTNQPGTTGPALDSISGTYTMLVSWTVPQATLQNWLDNPASNTGFVLVSDVGSTLTFHSSESPDLAPSPSLMFTTSVPEPTATIFLCFAALAFGNRRDRRSARQNKIGFRSF